MKMRRTISPEEIRVAEAPPVCPFCGDQRISRLYQRVEQGKIWRLAKCHQCDLHFTDPQPSAEDIKTFYTNDRYHSELRESGATEREFSNKYRRYLDWIRFFSPSGRTLDIGCATGLLVHLLDTAGYQAEGLEFNSRSAEWGIERYGIPIHIGTLEQFAGSGAAAYDVITVTDVIEHTERPLEALALVNRLLTPGGHAMVTFPDIRSVKSNYFRFVAWLTGRDWMWATCNVPFHTWEFTKGIAAECFRRSGFSIVGFRRTEIYDAPDAFVSRAIHFPARVLTVPFLGRRFGSQMEFMLKKTSMPNG
jgi:SAM-dependent methyltransferase